MKNTLFASVLAFFSLTACAHAIDLKEVEHLLNTTGLEGEVHGAHPEQGMYVLTYRNPKDFFDYIQMSMVSESETVSRTLATLARHDRVKVQGTFLDNPSPQKHVLVQALMVVKKFESPYPTPPYTHDAEVPKDLLDKKEALFLVHAVHGEGRILVVEYKDVVLPVFVRNVELTRDLFRGDLVRLSYRLQGHPGRPVHLRLDETAPRPVQMVEAIRDKHEKPGSVTGALVMFPKSPEIKFNVFAVLEQLPEGLTRQYTLVNFENMDAFTRIREKLQAAWDRHAKDYVNGRNKLVSTRVRVKATGIFNDIVPNQANPQILLEDADSIEILGE